MKLSFITTTIFSSILLLSGCGNAEREAEIKLQKGLLEVKINSHISKCEFSDAVKELSNLAVYEDQNPDVLSKKSKIKDAVKSIKDENFTYAIKLLNEIKNYAEEIDKIEKLIKSLQNILETHNAIVTTNDTVKNEISNRIVGDKTAAVAGMGVFEIGGNDFNSLKTNYDQIFNLTKIDKPSLSSELNLRFLIECNSVWNSAVNVYRIHISDGEARKLRDFGFITHNENAVRLPMWEDFDQAVDKKSELTTSQGEYLGIDSLSLASKAVKRLVDT